MYYFMLFFFHMSNSWIVNDWNLVLLKLLKNVFFMRPFSSHFFQKCSYYFITVCNHSLLWSRSFWRFLENAWMCNNIKMQWISTSIHQSLEIHSLEKRSIKARRRKWRFVKLFWFQHYSWLLLTKPMHPQDVI